MPLCPRCGQEAPDRLIGHRCEAVWRSCSLCGNRFRVSRAVATALFELAVGECPACCPSLHASLADGPPPPTVRLREEIG